jgi:hypothetical protein
MSENSEPIFFEEVLERLRKEVDDPFWLERIELIEKSRLQDDLGASFCVVLHVLLLKLEHLRETHRAYEDHVLRASKDSAPRLPFDGRLPNEVAKPLLAGRYYARRPTH